MATSFFITGTDTDIGKTFTACALLHAWRKTGLRAVGYKPIASGISPIGSEHANADALALQAASSEGFTLSQINPICLEEAIAPHIAAANQGVNFDFSRLLESYHHLCQEADCVLVEGVGGFLVPLDQGRTAADLARALNLPVILVVGLRLGCLNHALLTEQAIAASGLPLAGWIANTIDPNMPHQAENIATLRERLHAPYLGTLPYLKEAQEGAEFLVLP